jgi:DNA adenine methylase
MTNNVPKPILKWVGGKTQIIDKIIINFPLEINNYYEPFLGGGSVLLTLLTYIKNDIIGSAMFIFLNKTCFRGVFRIGPNGFNVPYGHYNNPEIINKEHLEEIHNLIQNVIFKYCDYNTSLINIEVNDFIYLDPPYVPEKETSFVKYTLNGFNIENHNNLFTLIHKLTEENKKLLLSNSDVKLVRENFTSEKYNITSILCKRSINSKNPESKTNEVLIKNY